MKISKERYPYNGYWIGEWEENPMTGTQGWAVWYEETSLCPLDDELETEEDAQGIIDCGAIKLLH